MPTAPVTMNGKLISSFASVARFWKDLRASRSARGGVCGGFFPLQISSLDYVQMKL